MTAHAHSANNNVPTTGQKAKRDWGLFFFGLAFVLCGFVVLLWPGLTLITLATIAGVILLVTGFAEVISYFRSRTTVKQSGWAIVTAILNIILGAMFLIHPIAAAGVITWVAGAFVAAYGIFAIATAISIRSLGSFWLLMLANGILSVFIGFMFVFVPESFVLFLAIFLMMRGVTMSVYGLTMPGSIPYV